MTVRVSFDEQDQIIILYVREDFNWSVIEQGVPQISRFALEKNNHRVLLDFRSANITLSTVQIYMTPDKLADEFKKYGVNILNLRRALLLKKNDPDYHFLETVVINKFQTFRTFFNEAEARAWLKELWVDSSQREHSSSVPYASLRPLSQKQLGGATTAGRLGAR